MSTTTYVALLRGVNVAGRTLSMEALRGIFRALGHEDVATYIQSGNVIFRTSRSDEDVLVEQLRAAVSGEVGHPVTVVLRTAAQLAVVISGNPFLDAHQAHTLHVTFLAQQPDQTRLDALGPPSAGPDEFRRIGHEIFVRCPNGYGRTALSNEFFERRLAVAATTRNWRTVTTLAGMAGA